MKVKKIVVGLVAGIISGLFASGGGMILVPAFLYILKLQEKQARATSIFCILPMVIASSFFYLKGDYIDWKVGISAAIGGMIGGFLGSKLLKKISNRVLKLGFTIFLLYVSIRMLFF